MNKHLKNSPTLKTLLQAAYLSTAMAVPSYVLAVEVGVGFGAGVNSGPSTIDSRNSVGTGVVTDSRRTGVNATGASSITGTGAGTGTGSITGSGIGTGTVNSTGTTGTTGGITGTTGIGVGNNGAMGTMGTTGTTGTTGTGIGGIGISGTGTGGNMGTGAGPMPGQAPLPSGLDGNLNQNSQIQPDATRGQDRAEERMNMQDANEQGTVKSKSSVKAKGNTRNRSNSTTQ